MSAAEAVRDSLFLKLKGVKTITPQEWNQLQSISAVRSSTFRSMVSNAVSILKLYVCM